MINLKTSTSVSFEIGIKLFILSYYLVIINWLLALIVDRNLICFVINS